MKIIDRMVGAGNTVIVIEHHLDVIRQADWVIEMGPGGGSAGGNVVFAGTPRALLKSQKSVTAKYLNPDTTLKGQA
jgi:excinuclease UvrABC ATPase subunit